MSASILFTSYLWIVQVVNCTFSTDNVPEERADFADGEKKRHFVDEINNTHVDCTETGISVPAEGVVLTVTDNGIGIAPDMLPKVSKPFSQCGLLSVPELVFLWQSNLWRSTEGRLRFGLRPARRPKFRIADYTDRIGQKFK
jgi:Histidine kinase-, DNA gyrase B-, and HSP90-like ATPase